MFNKTFFKFTAGFLTIIGATLGLIYLTSAWQAGQQEREEQKIIDDLNRAYQEDTFGGTTPEETLQLFIDALKAGDMELASRYFVLEKQGEMRENLKIGKGNGGVQTFLNYLHQVDDGKEIYNGAYQFTVAENGIAKMNIDLIFNPITNRWKIESL